MSDLTFVEHDPPIPMDTEGGTRYSKFATVYWHGYEFLEIVRYNDEYDADDEEHDELQSEDDYENRWYIHPVNESFHWSTDAQFSLEEALKACLDAETKIDQLRRDLTKMFRNPRVGETTIHKRLTP